MIVALTFLLALVSLLQRWAKSFLLWPVLVLSGVALWFTDSRGGMMAAFLGLCSLVPYALRQKRSRMLLGLTLVALVLAGAVYVLLPREAGLEVRVLPDLNESLTNLTSNRSDIWPQALWAIRQRPLLGYGFDGFGTAWPSIEAQSNPTIREVLRIGDKTFSYFDGERVWVGTIPNFYDKAHNVVLDWTLAVGIPGFLAYAVLVAFLLWVTVRSRVAPLVALTVAYLGFTLIWYDAAQFAYLGFWGLSVGLAFDSVATGLGRGSSVTGR